jgi:hypothetical protein
MMGVGIKILFFLFQELQINGIKENQTGRYPGHLVYVLIVEKFSRIIVIIYPGNMI